MCVQQVHLLAQVNYFGWFGTAYGRRKISIIKRKIMFCYLKSQLKLSLYHTRRENARPVTAFNSTDIRAEQDNVATLVTAMMITVCISTDIRPATELV